MCSLVKRSCLRCRTAQPINGGWSFTLFAALLCLCALTGNTGAREAPKTNTVVATLLPAQPPSASPNQEPAAGASGNAGTVSPQEAKTPSDSGSPLTAHPPGIYYAEQKGDTHQLVELEKAPSGGRSSGGGMGRRGRNTAGTRKWKSVVYGSNARIRLPAGRPVFYFYFPPPDASASGYSETAFRPSSTPNGFLLVHLKTKKNEREIPAESVSATVEPKDLVPFDYEKVAAGIYKVQLKNDLAPGEYGFLFGETLQSMADVSLFDFGVDGAK